MGGDVEPAARVEGGPAAEFDVAGLSPLERLVGTDGTRKFLFALRDGQTVESVIIPMEAHATFCISSQVGCAMACRFCATARGGLVRNLTRGEILEQVQRLRRELAAEPFPSTVIDNSTSSSWAWANRWTTCRR